MKVYKKAKGKKFLALLTMLVMLSTMLSGCKPNPQNFTMNKLTITLNDSFEERKASSIGLDLYMVSDDVSFSIVEETDNEIENAGYEIISLDDYSKQLFELNGDTGTSLEKRDDYYYFITTEVVSNAKYTYIHCIYEGGSSYYICEFICKSKDYKRLENTIFSWADSVTIKK